MSNSDDSDAIVVTGTQYNSILSTDYRPIALTNKYSNFLPSVNAKLNIRDDLILRGAVSKSLTRPSLGALNPAVVFPATLRPGGLRASGGGGNLSPYTAWNYDASLEWYYSRTGYVSVAYFRKDVDGLIVNSVVPYKVAIANADGINNSDIAGNSANFELSTAINLGSLRVTGREIAVQHSFDYLPSVFKNLGVTASITLPSTNRQFNKASFNNTGGAPGLSDSYFLTGYYDDGTFEARVTYSHRDTYFDGMNGATEPRYVRSSNVWDARISYNLNEQIQLFADAFNLTNEPIRTEGRYSSQFLTYEQNGARYDAGVRLKF